jgi:hypothetical protein
VDGYAVDGCFGCDVTSLRCLVRGWMFMIDAVGGRAAFCMGGIGVCIEGAGKR